MEFTLLAMDKVIWPATLICVLLILREPLRLLLPFAQSIKFKEFEVSFSQELEQVSEQATDALPKYNPPASPIKSQRLIQNAGVLPNQSILEAWKSVDASAQALLLSQQPNIKIPEKQRYKFMGEHLLQSQLITQKQAKLFHELRQLRNKVAHAKNYSVNSVLAVQYIELCLALVEYLDQAHSNFKSAQAS
jgi:hypothetical protein